MLKRVLVVVAVVAGCQGPESFHDRLGVSVGPTGAAGIPGGGAGTGVVPVTGEAGVGALPTGAAGGAALPGAAGAGDAGQGAAGTPATGAAGSGVTGAAGNTPTTGAAGSTTGAAGTTTGAAGTPDAGQARPDAGARDAAPEAPAPSVAYASTGWKPTASITAAGNADVPPNAFDGNLATRWTTGRNQMGNETFLVDLGKVESVSRVVLDDTTHPTDFPVAYTLEVSTDNVTFTAVKTGKGATITDIQFTRVNARYVRIRQTGTNAAGGSWWSIDELRIYS